MIEPPGERTAAVRTLGVEKSYGATAVLVGIDLEVPAGSVSAILGSSGSGKTTLLRLIAGFDQPDRGQIMIAGRVVDDGARTVRARHRGIGYVPQDAALFPHMSVAGNIGFGVARRQRHARVAEMLDLVDLAGFEHRYPHQLSGGQRQRIALARALATGPSVVLLDEPFGSLDAQLREAVRGDVLAILRKTGTTTMLVTHDQDEALSVADHIALLDAGRIVASGAPRELYLHPATPRIARAIGIANLLAGNREGETVTCALGVLAGAPWPDSADHPDGRGVDPGRGSCDVLIRPEQLRIRSSAAPHDIPATITALRYHGHDTLLELAVQTAASADPLRLVARAARQSEFLLGQAVGITVTTPVHTWPAVPPDRQAGA